MGVCWKLGSFYPKNIGSRQTSGSVRKNGTPWNCVDLTATSTSSECHFDSRRNMSREPSCYYRLSLLGGGYIASQCLVSLSLLRGPYRFPVFRAHLWQKTNSILKWSSAILTVTHINRSNILHHDHMLHCCPNGSQLVPTGPNGSHLCLSTPTEDCPGTKSIIQPGCANKAAGMATTALDEECLSIVIPCFTCDDKLQLYRFKTLLSRWS